LEIFSAFSALIPSVVSYPSATVTHPAVGYGHFEFFPLGVCTRALLRFFVEVFGTIATHSADDYQRLLSIAEGGSLSNQQ